MKREQVKLPLTNSWVFHWILSLISTITENKTTFLRQSRWKYRILHFRSSPPEVFLGNVVLKIYSKFTGEHQCRSVICNFIKTTLRYECSPVNLAYFFGTPFPKNTFGILFTSPTTLSYWWKKVYLMFLTILF